MTMARVTLHVGMPKTGTTTLQHMFEGRHGDDAVFVGPASAGFQAGRHFCVLATCHAGWPPDLSRDDPMRRVLLAHRDRTLDLLGAQSDRRDDARARFAGFLGQHPGRVVLSDESLAGWRAQAPIAQVLRDCGRSFDVLGYIRQIATATTAQLQEMIRSSPGAVIELIRGFPDAARLRPFSPDYRATFAPWDDLAGPERVAVRPYPALGGRGDTSLIRDFSDQIGLQPLRPSPPLNRQDSAEVSAISYALLHDMAQSGFDQALYDMPRSICAGLGRERLTLSPAALRQITRWRMPDLVWAQDRTGCDLAAHSPGGGLEISSLADLCDIAAQLRGPLASHIKDRWSLTASASGLRACFADLRSRLIDDAGRLTRLPADFDAQAYRDAHPDIAHAGVDPGLHYRLHGFREGRRLSLAHHA